jgi:hypothetical protein
MTSTDELNSVIEFAEKAERYDLFDIIRACQKIRKLGEGSYSKMILTGKLDFWDYGVGFLNFEIRHYYHTTEKQHYSRIWFATIDDGDMGAWVPFSSKEEVIVFNDKFAEQYLKDLSIFPTLEELNKQLRPFGIYITRE